MSAEFLSFTGQKKAKQKKETPAVKAQRIVANLLTVHLAKRQTVGLDTPLDDEDHARLSLVMRIHKGQHGGENTRPLLLQAFPNWPGAQPKELVTPVGD